MQANEKKLLNSTAEEYHKLTGIHILMGIFGLPRLRLYFIKGIDIPIITQLPRDRIFKLRNYLHVVDNLSISDQENQSNTFWKVQPIRDSVRAKCITLPRTKDLSIDEQMIPFTGTSSLVQYVKNKPNPVGLKNFVLAIPSGLVLNFFIYQGAKTWPDGSPEKDLGIGGSVMKKVSDNLSPGHVLYFDRYFTSLNLLDYLLTKGILGVGTIMNNRVPRVVRDKIKKDKDLLSNGRGSYDEWERTDKKMSLLKWMDSRAVTMASTSSGSAPICDLHSYNRSMGGIDLCDRFISYYRICMRTKKSPVRVFWHFIDLAITNAWIEYKQDCLARGDRKNTVMDLLEFKLYIGRSLALGGQRQKTLHDRGNNDSAEENIPAKRKKSTSLPPKDVRKTGNDNLPICSVNDKNSSYMRCRNEGCTKKTRFNCLKCQVDSNEYENNEIKEAAWRSIIADYNISDGMNL
ncbi:unnamed protein product [Acanthoscelides obtectus]|uniref:PiggyBac transposable element-derived protein domain-containing protein n=1 Tax=Acanthoscelides obtectus TaxID=200917 RepID=A0A9P0QBU6_ACAOB|nr:unnamed protein product [Acanthoscelides obtectus]CAK1682485.1 PiggyBac transposable element-derived protein 3 [Acanthoscelides obtectus]